MRKLRTSVQDAYTKRDVAIARANDLERELMHLRDQMARAQEMPVASSKVGKRRYSDEERETKDRERIHTEAMDVELKMSKFRVSYLDTKSEERGKADLLSQCF